MKQSKLASTLAVTLSFQLMVSPLVPIASAADEQETKNKPDRGADPELKAANAVNSTADAIGVAIEAVGQIWGQVRQGMSSNYMTPQLAGDLAKLKEQQTPSLDKYFNSQKLLQIPGLANYLALNNINPNMLNCYTLATTLYEAKPEVCRIGITNDTGLAPQMQIAQMQAYADQYSQIEKLYKNYMSDSNIENQAFGVGCMNNAVNILNGFFKYRLNELDKLTTNLEAMQNQFKQAARSDLDAIEEATAVLDGNSALADKVRSKKPDLFDFQKRFNNDACNSMFAGEELNKLGREGGLNQISSKMKEISATKVGKFSGDSYTKNHAAVVDDLEKLADKVSKQLELNFSGLAKDPNTYSQFLSDLPNLVSSPNGLNRALSPDHFSDVQTKFTETFIKLNEQRSTILSELSAVGIRGEVATNLLGNATSNNFESEVMTIENNLKNKCFQDTLSEIDVNKIMGRIYDPTASGHANKFASNFIKDKLLKIINNKETSLEKKLAELKALESQNAGRYYLKMENAYEVQEVDENGNLKTEVVSASNIRTPSVFFSDLIRNCNAQFKSNKLNNKLSGASAIQKLRELNQQYKALAKSQAADIKNEVRRKLIECSSPEEANNTNPGSCTPDRFNTSSPNFCANAAFSCSKNMQACTQQAAAYTKEIKDQRTARVNNYKALVEKNKNDIVKMFDTALASYMKDGEILRGLFGAGFSSPTGIQREVPESEKYLAEFAQATTRSPDGELLLEDPEAYLRMFKQNIALLKKSVEDQQNQILGGSATGMGAKAGGLLGQHIQKTNTNYKNVSSEANSFAQMCLNKHDSAVAAAEQQRARQQEEHQKKMSELGEKRNEFCARLEAFSSDPDGACENIGSLSREVLNTLNTTEARRTAGEFSRHCRTRNATNTTERNEPSLAEYAKACQWAGWGTTGTTGASRDSGTVDQVKRLCEQADQCFKDAKPVERDGKIISSSDDRCKVFQQMAINTWSSAISSDRQTGDELTPIAFDAGAVCGATDNSNSRFAKAIQEISGGIARGYGASAK